MKKILVSEQRKKKRKRDGTSGEWVQEAPDGRYSTRVYSPKKSKQTTRTRDAGSMRTVQRVRSGVGIEALDRLKNKLDLTERELAKLLRISERTLDRRRRDHTVDTDLSDHIVALLGIFSEVLQLFEGDENDARHWLKSPEKALGNKLPIEVIELEVGRKLVHELIGRLEHGIFT